MSNEFVDVFDKNRIFQNRTVLRGIPSDADDFRLIVHVWLRFGSRFLITKRVEGIFFGGYWQPTGGHAVAGELSVEAAVRELQEETGICISFDDAQFLFDYAFSAKNADAHSFFLDAWLFDISAQVEKTGETEFLQGLSLQKNEVSDAKFADFDEILSMWRDGDFMPFDQTFPPYFEKLRETAFSAEFAPSVAQVQKEAIRRLVNCQKTESSVLDSRLILAFSLRKDADFLIRNPKMRLARGEIENFENALSRREKGENVAYILGKKSFWKHDFLVSPAVLVPKPDTEILVEKAILQIKSLFSQNNIKIADICTAPNNIKIADICTGSGCVLISILSEFCQISSKILAFATDISVDALKIAKKNAEKIIPSQKINFFQGDLLDALKDEADFDLILANPPYVPTEIAKNLLQDGRGEPFLALDGGSDGTDLIRRLVFQARSRLKRGGAILLETGEYNAAKTRKILAENGFCQIETVKDLSGAERVTCGIFGRA